MELTSKTALITGSTRGIGAAIALTFAKAGCQVIINGRQADIPESLREQLELINANYQYIQADIADKDSISNLVNKIYDTNSKIDILINNAGITNDKLMMRMKESDFDRVLNINLRGTFMVTQQVFKRMLKQKSGCIVNLASVVGLHGNIGQANYAASKAGVIGLTKTIAQEGALRGIRCNAIAPGMIASDMTDALNDRVKDEILNNIPLKRLGNPNEVAQTAKFLVENDYITGQTIVIDGGMTI
ncbi:3-oxoacyl-[acyl-carrier-protein] reductase [Limosilactobacillus sp. STM2_1]|uniref:3-oxoacyl-[acyl-carrier-protein] reductase n=1 Tax=Limosilactobacillus rudii TaxID=2759755 RepID=A0A7W3YNK2_9LACO|nr:3-oxoacyl-[acyl-carrier-protein] reductase [Limosilactobacillus rudii]MBB1078871.1 3-oxoacyl-[acyl-carrier-protein] reductase [Limosilactobacillus rudii]MBB1098253.1 3-oxoacyl-[acyl-carrier-protein] reductase [Limosilactobacillus rudii]MCD7135632.1 3-oxoacyl-[acyl-carrier-protein] reductase [Limosilactobacillus rudii]